MKKKICTLASIAFVCIISISAVINSKPEETRIMVPYGVRDATGNPANIGVGNCSGCHQGTAVNSGGSLTIVVKDAKGNSISTYDFNKTYTVEVTVARPNVSTFGFDTEVVTANNTDAGIITSTDTTKIITLRGDRSTNITHFTPGKTKNSHTFSFAWQTPLADSGVVTIYAAGLAANGDVKNIGDYTYTNVKTLKPVSAATVHENPKELSGVSIYPNPVSSSFQLSYTFRGSGNVHVNLYALNGQKVAELLNTQQTNGLQEEKISLPEYTKNGVYILQIHTGKTNAFEKMIIDKDE
jgi:hypothetical protein